ncbi:ATP-grasp fold amidoligase family protein [Candidatus Ventrimonas sp. KK005]
MDDKKKSIVRSFKQISETGKRNHRIIIFGAGNFGKYACQYCKKIFPETKISFCDNDKDRQWQTLCECEILPPKAATKEYPNAIYIVANDFYAHEMEKQLSLDGIQKNQIYLFGRQDYYSLLSLDEMWQVNQKIYEEITGKFIDKHALKTFTEKMQYSKIYLSNEQKTRLTDKYLVRKWVEEKIGDRYLVPLLNVYDTPDDINFDKLPDSFVLKANHGCEMNLIVPDKRKLNQKQAVEQMWSWMNNNFAYYSFELHYKDIKPCIVAEEYIKEFEKESFDYKFFCFDGKVKMIMLVKNIHQQGAQRCFYDDRFHVIPCVLNDGVPMPKVPFEKPDGLEKMIHIAEVLSQGIDQVRVDLYGPKGRIYFGEMTFTSWSGRVKVEPIEVDERLGSYWNMGDTK